MRALFGAAAVGHLGLIAIALSACGNSSSPDPASNGGMKAQPMGGGGGAIGGAATVSESGSATGGVAGAATTGGAPPAVSGAAGAAVSGAGGSSGNGSGGGGGADVTDQTIVPDASWTCGKPAGIVAPTRGTLVLNATLELGEAHDVGATPLTRPSPGVTLGAFPKRPGELPLDPAKRHRS